MGNVHGGEMQMKRRTVVKGAAWVAPVVTMGAAAPTLAATPPPVTPSIGQGSCKHAAGVKRYHIELIFTNNQTCETTVKIQSFVVNPFSGQNVEFTDPPVDTEFDLGADGGSLSWVYDSDVVGNMANGTVDVTYSYTDCSTPPQTVDEFQQIEVSSLPPCSQFGLDYPHA